VLESVVDIELETRVIHNLEPLEYRYQGFLGRAILSGVVVMSEILGAVRTEPLIVI
jgi:hypothetical protein